jgi:hypothetical protein
MGGKKQLHDSQAFKTRYTGIFHIHVERQVIIKTHRNFVRRLTTKDHTFASAHFHRFLV